MTEKYYLKMKTLNGVPVMTTADLAMVLGTYRRRIALKLKTYHEMFGADDTRLLKGPDYRRFLLENKIASGYVSDKARVFMPHGITSMLEVFCAGHVAIDWERQIVSYASMNCQ